MYDVELFDVLLSLFFGKVLFEASDYVKEVKFDCFIIYSFFEVWGYDNDSLIFGIVAFCYTVVSVLYVWYRNGLLYK